MRVRIHFQWSDGTEDHFVVEGDPEDCRKQAHEGLQSRGVSEDSAWSDVIEP